MTADSIAPAVSDALALDVGDFDERVREEAAFVKHELREGTFDNSQAIVGLEYEFYAVADGTARLARMPRPLLRLIGFEKELGLHNAEMQTSPQPLNAYGLTSQLTEIQARLAAAQERAAVDDIRLVSDGMWTAPPTGESAAVYLTDSVTYDGVRLGTNVSDGVRYHGFSNADVEIGRRIDLPGVDVSADTSAPASLTTTVQPHFQVAQAVDLPAHFRYALRAAGPMLATAVNSPFLPPELYDADAETILEEGWHENRVPVFEGVMNPVDGPDKVRFPRDIDRVEEAVDRIAEDPTLVPAEYEGATRFDDAFPHFRHKHGSYWRWIRPVFDGASEEEANARIEFRPLPAQPTVPDSVACQAVFAGLMASLPVADHPVASLSWERARRNFYAAARDGLDADLVWITADGDETRDRSEIYRELFRYAREGLERRGLSAPEAESYVAPLRERVERATTPAEWKRERVRERLVDGQGFAEAVYGTQAEYVRRQRETLLEGHFVDW